MEVKDKTTLELVQGSVNVHGELHLDSTLTEVLIKLLTLDSRVLELTTVALNDLHYELTKHNLYAPTTNTQTIKE